jgi:hypothetical protein
MQCNLEKKVPSVVQGNLSILDEKAAGCIPKHGAGLFRVVAIAIGRRTSRVLEHPV